MFKRIPKKETAKKEIVIPVIGPKGVGKSTFINTLLMKVNTEQNAASSDLAIDYIETIHGYDFFKDHRIAIIDAPGFDDTYNGDSKILQKIADLFEKDFKNAEFGGVIYLHDISDDSSPPGMARRNLDMLQHLIGKDFLANVVLGTTKWKKLSDLDLGYERQENLKALHWNPLLAKGSQFRPFWDSYESAWGFIEDIVATLEEQFSEHPESHGRQLDRKISATKDESLEAFPALTENDIVVPVIGPTGAGKSTFIRALNPPPDMDSADPKSTSHTIDLDFKYIDLKGHRMVFVDSPGLQGSYLKDSEIFRRIFRCMKDSKAVLGGVVYLHDMQSDSGRDVVCWNVEMFQSFSGQDSIRVALGITKCDPLLVEACQKELKDNDWRRLIEKGAEIFPFDNTYESAQRFIDFVINAQKLSEPLDDAGQESSEKSEAVKETGLNETQDSTTQAAPTSQAVLKRGYFFGRLTRFLNTTKRVTSHEDLTPKTSFKQEVGSVLST